jgi:hypothetical protein
MASTFPRYRNVGKDKRDYLRGFGYQGRAARAGYGRFNDSALIGASSSRRSRSRVRGASA